MVNDLSHKYDLGDTVRIGNPRGKPGIVEDLKIVETLEISNLGHKASKFEGRKVRYGVRSEAILTLFYDEGALYDSEVQLHKDAFRIRPGQIFLRDGKEYLVEGARFVQSPSNQGYEHEVWAVKARDFSSGKLNPETEPVQFEQGKDEPLEIVGELEEKVS